MDGQSYYLNSANEGWKPSDNNFRIKSYTKTISPSEKPSLLSSFEVDGLQCESNYLTNSVWIRLYTGRAKELTIPSEINGIPVKGILAKAFEANTTIKKLIISNISTIGDYAFWKSTIKELEIRNVDMIGISAFATSAVSKVTLENIGTLSYLAFQNCRELTDVQLLGHFGTIGNMVFTNTGIKTVTFPDVDTLCNPFFWDDKIEEINVTGTIKNWELRIFNSMHYDRSILSPTTGISCSYSINLKKLNVTGKVLSFTYSPFASPVNDFDIDALRKLLDQIEITFSEAKNGILYDETGKILLILPDQNEDTLIIDDEHPISDFALDLSSNQKHLIINSSNPFENIYINSMCDLESVQVLSPDTKLIFSGYFPKLTDVSFEQTGCSFTFNYLGYGGVPSSYIHRFGFVEHELTIHAPADPKMEEAAKMYYFSYDNTTTNELTRRKGLVSADYIFGSEGHILLGFKYFKKVMTIPDGCTEIGCSVFAMHDGNWDLDNSHTPEKIILPDTVTTIGAYAFCNDTHLSEIILGNNTKKIGESAFMGCWALNSLDLGDKIEELGDNFLDDVKLPVLHIPASLVVPINEHTFAYSHIRELIFDGDCHIDPINYSLFYYNSTPPEKVVINGVVHTEYYGQLIDEYQTIEFTLTNKDLFYYNLKYYAYPLLDQNAELNDIGIDETILTQVYKKALNYNRINGTFGGFPYIYEVWEEKYQNYKNSFSIFDHYISIEERKALIEEANSPKPTEPATTQAVETTQSESSSEVSTSLEATEAVTSEITKEAEISSEGAETVSQPSKKSGLLFPIILGSIILLAVAAGAAFAVRKRKK